MIVIPFRDLPAFTEDVILDGETYRLDFAYNNRGEYWSLSLFTREGGSIIHGIKIVPNFELLQRYGTRGQPPGELYCIDVTNSQQPVDRDNLVHLFQLVYVPESELASVQ